MKKKNIVTHLIIVPTSGAEAFGIMRPEIVAVPDERLIRISVDIPYAHGIVIAAARRIEPLIPELQKLPGFDMQRVYKLRLVADACRHAHLLATSPESADPRVPALVKEGVELRERLLGSAELLALFGYVSEEKCVAIRAGAGNIDMTNDLEQLEVLFRGMPADVKAKTPVTQAMIDRAATLSHELCDVFGLKQHGGAIQLNENQRMRQKAYALLVFFYDEVRRGVAFIRGAHGDADEIAPSLYLKQRRRSTNEEVDDSDEPDDPVVTPPVEPATAVVPAPAPATGTNGTSTA